MFTGIVQEKGCVNKIVELGDAIQVTINAPGFFTDCCIGDSVANNGVCLTIEECDNDSAMFTMVKQTLAASAFKTIAEKDVINLEKACRPDSFLGGHYVMGHVDGVAEVINVTPNETGVEVYLKLPEMDMKYVISKGSITLHGISLTVAEKNDDNIKIAIIPETIGKTNLGKWIPGTLINFEVDVLGKYVESIIGSKLDDLLKEKGNKC